MAAMDNTCRWGYGFVPTGTEPGVCYIPPTPTPTPLPGSISGIVFRDWNENTIIDGADSGYGSVTVKLGQGACSSTGYMTTTTTGSGSYLFDNLPAGTYCITVEFAWDSCGGWEEPASHPRTITIGAGEDRTGVNFGLRPTGPC